MKIALTGADRELGALLCRGLGQEHAVAALGTAAGGGDLGACVYHRVDLRDSAAVEPLLEGVEALVHTLPFEAPLESGAQAEQELLDLVARSTYVLMRAACEAKMKRVVLISQMALLADYPEDYLVGPEWNPLPRPEASSLAPYLAELIGREIARTGKIEVVCVRFGVLGESTRTAEAVRAVQRALEAEALPRGYTWTLEHAVSSGRFARSGGGR